MAPLRRGGGIESPCRVFGEVLVAGGRDVEIAERRCILQAGGGALHGRVAQGWLWPDCWCTAEPSTETGNMFWVDAMGWA